MEIKDYLKENYVLLFFIIISGLTIIILGIPFLIHNNLNSWDGSGHISALEYLNEKCFPNFVCWNQHYLLGYPQGQFYPQGPYWLSSLFSHILGINVILILKILILISLILFPFSVYYFFRSINLDNSKNIFLTAISYFLFLSVDPYIGGNLRSVLDIGFYTQFISIPLLFFYAGALKNYLDKKISILIPTFLLSSIILTHIMTSVGAVIFIFSIFIYLILIEKRSIYQTLESLFIHLFLVAGLTAFWVIPFLLKLSYTSSVRLSANYIISPIYSLLIVFILSLFFLIKKRKDSIVPLWLLFIILFSVISDNFIDLPLHMYRLSFITYILFISSLSILFFNISSLWAKIVPYTFLFLSIIFLITSYNELNIKGIYEQDVPNLPKIENSRYYINVIPQFESSPHFLQTIAPYKNDILSTKGLFIEGSKNSPFIMGFEQKIDSRNLVWSSYLPKEYYQNNENYNFINNSYEIFGISHILYSENNLSLEEKINYYKEKDKPIFRNTTFKTLKVSDSKIIESINYTPSQLKTSISDWFYNYKEVEYFSIKDIPQYNNYEKGNIENITIKKDLIEFETDKPSNVVIKISYFPNWKAYDKNGKRIIIYEITPSIMFIHAPEGKISIKYEYLFYEKALIFISFISLIILIYILTSPVKNK